MACYQINYQSLYKYSTQTISVIDYNSDKWVYVLELAAILNTTPEYFNKKIKEMYDIIPHYLSIQGIYREIIKYDTAILILKNIYERTNLNRDIKPRSDIVKLVQDFICFSYKIIQKPNTDQLISLSSLKYDTRSSEKQEYLIDVLRKNSKRKFEEINSKSDNNIPTKKQKNEQLLLDLKYNKPITVKNKSSKSKTYNINGQVFTVTKQKYEKKVVSHRHKNLKNYTKILTPMDLKILNKNEILTISDLNMYIDFIKKYNLTVFQYNNIFLCSRRDIQNIFPSINLTVYSKKHNIKTFFIHKNYYMPDDIRSYLKGSRLLCNLDSLYNNRKNFETLKTIIN